MKRVILLLGVLLAILFASFWWQNSFLLGVPFVQNGKSTWADLDRLLGKRYLMVRENSIPPGRRGRIYLLHFGSYIICQYDLELYGATDDYLKDRVVDDSWQKKMAWDRHEVLKEVDRFARQQ